MSVYTYMIDVKIDDLGNIPDPRFLPNGYRYLYIHEIQTVYLTNTTNDQFVIYDIDYFAGLFKVPAANVTLKIVKRN